MAHIYHTSEGSLEIADSVLEAVVRHAQRQASLTAAVLDSILEGKKAALPSAFHLELGAVVELGLWERNGLRALLGDIELPSYQEAAHELASRALKGPAEFDGPDAAPFSLRLFRTWIERIAWDGPNYMDSECVLSRVDEDEFVDVLAQFVWENRHQLAQLFSEGAN